ncbi:MAG: uridine kinase [Oscillochloris sp.]|nr:uridine kinase [Oscillochloris sp.]
MNTNRPLMLGIVGDGGSGKATLTRGVARLLGSNGVTPICLDDYQRYDRSERLARRLTTADPAANQLDLMAEHLAALRIGGTIQKPGYDHRCGVRRAPEAVAATGLVIAYGMHTLTPPSLAGLFDLTIYLEPDDDLQQIWRFARDTRERGYSAAQVISLQPANDSAARRYVAGQRCYTDLVAHPHMVGNSDTAQTLELLVRRTPVLSPLQPFLAFVEAQALPGTRVERGIADEDGLIGDRLWIDAHLDPVVSQALLGSLWPPQSTSATLQLGAISSLSSAGATSPGFTLIQVLVSSLLVQSRG